MDEDGEAEGEDLDGGGEGARVSGPFGTVIADGEGPKAPHGPSVDHSCLVAIRSNCVSGRCAPEIGRSRRRSPILAG